MMTSASLECATQEGGISAPDLLTGRDMLCFSHDWTGDPLSKTHLMRLLSRENRILWVNSIGYRAPTASRRDAGRILCKLKAATDSLRQVEKNIYVLNPLAIPAWGKPWVRRLNYHALRFQVRRAMRRLGFHRPLNWVFNPTAGVIAGSLNEEQVIYYCVDEYTAFSGVATSPVAEIERRLMDRSDLIVVSAERLLATKRSTRARTVLVRHGVDYDHFRQSLDPTTEIPPEISQLRKPVIGYFGLIAEDWVDVSLLVHVARSLPQASIVMLGKVTMDVSRLLAEPNIHILGRKPYGSLPAYCKGFDVALIPFPISEVTLSSNPLKAREYLAAGLPVVSTAIPEVEILGQCHIGRTPDDFVAQIREALKDPGPKVHRSRTMESESWTARIEEIRAHCAMLR